MATLRPTLLALAAIGLLAGCGSDDDPRGATAAPTTTAGASSTPSSTTPAATQTEYAYLLRDGKVARVAREVPDTPGVAAAAMRALLDGPTADERAAGLTSAVPDGTTLRGVALRDGVATVDLSSAFAEDADQASLLARVAQVVYTLTAFTTIQRVAFAIDGQPATTIGEVAAVDPPLGRADLEDQTPQILVESPVPGATVSSPLRVVGTANTFEATFAVELLDGERRVAKQIVTATSGSGTRGTFDVSVPFDTPPGTALELYAYEPSAENGDPIHEVRIALRSG